MRHLVLALMIALLPIRGWVGEVMATEMATEMASSRSAQPEFAIKNIAAHAQRTGAEGHFGHQSADAMPATAMADCADHGDAAGADTAPSCDACASCQACHTVALSPAGVHASPGVTAQTPRPTLVARFASADMAPGHKPPIS